ncbi:helix-turn-helix domain-containing protein [Streptosporangium sp. NBC_01810]|uniref:helix-turn-helix domain-containing protein n=1 Tax=Streptosporangium sp. NBC_01810 TaxID=2975951 RepID=UPI002DDB81A5|nr:helix-turn-helix transcriptional regulator [Streptosporangium sp. NBC_01810]WSA25431.1 helix-turn-helix domain-containing protein [Streptosporangium sp. NBC_01810]
MAGSGPTVRQRRLASELRRLRELKGLTGEQAARRVGWQPSKISRIEHCTSRVKPADLITLLDAYEVSGKVRQTLIILQASAREQGWWDVYDDLSSDYSGYIGLESDAVAIRCYSMQLVHGLLQTEDYARAVIEATMMSQGSAEEVDKRVEVRMTRQATLSKPDPLNIHTIIDEAALRRIMGDPEVMSKQYAHLLAQAHKPHVTIQILPNDAGAHPAVVGPFAILNLHGPHPDIVYIETLASNIYIESDTEVHRYNLVFDHLRVMALGPDDSLAFLRAIATAP